MTKKEQNKAITRFSKVLRGLVGRTKYDNVFSHATIYLHGYSKKNIPPGFVLKDQTYGHKPYDIYEYKDPDGVFIITIFT